MVSIQRNLWALSGVGFVALFGLGFLFSIVLSTEPFPSPFGPPFGPATDIERYFANNQAQVQMMSFLYSLAALLLLIFAVHISSIVRQVGDDTGAQSTLALSGGILASAFAQLSALFLWVLARPTMGEDPALLRTMHDLAYLTGGPAHVLAFVPFIGASSIAFLNKPIVPRWINWMGVAAAVVSLLSLTALLWVPATLLLPLGRGLAFGWIFFVSLALARGVQVERRQPLTQTPRARALSGNN